LYHTATYVENIFSSSEFKLSCMEP